MSDYAENERIFTQHDGYFSLIEPSLWVGGKAKGWTKTHIIYTGNAMRETSGIQIIRFFKSIDDTAWSLTNNPYAGIYLTKDEWEKVFKVMRSVPVKNKEQAQ